MGQRIHDWLIDSGASGHFCKPGLAQGSIHPTDTRIETANGTVPAIGTSTTNIDVLNKDIDVTLLKDSPNLLSLGLLINDGFRFHWDSLDSCILFDQSGKRIPVKVENFVPILHDIRPANSTFVAGAYSEYRHPHAFPTNIISGMEEEHRQNGHFPYSPNCRICVESAIRSDPHQRRKNPHYGSLSIDLCAYSMSGPHVLVGTMQCPPRVYVE